jgi:hypothetical protein
MSSGEEEEKHPVPRPQLDDEEEVPLGAPLADNGDDDLHSPPQEEQEGEGEGGEEGGGQEGLANMLEDPNFMQFFMRMLANEAEKKDLEKKKERRIAGDVQVAALRSRRHELRVLALDALPPLLVAMGHNVWQIVLGMCEAKDLARMGATCWYFRALTEDDSYWEKVVKD